MAEIAVVYHILDLSANPKMRKKPKRRASDDVFPLDRREVIVYNKPVEYNAPQSTAARRRAVQKKG